MKKLFLNILVAVFTLSIYSCRETTQDKTEDALEAIGDDIEDGTRKAAEEVEEGARKVEQEIDEEIHDDHQIEEETDQNINN